MPDVLSIDDISQLHSPYAQLAYLSACSTAENNTTVLADEVIHPDSGFQVAGSSQVIGSTWAWEDQICAEVAQVFYENLSVMKEMADLGGSAARSLHAGVAKIRSQWWIGTARLAGAQYYTFRSRGKSDDR